MRKARTSQEYAVHLSTTIAAAWPRAKVPDETCLLWAKVLQQATEDVAEETVEVVSRFEGPPSKRELEEAVRVVRERLHPELPIAPEETGRRLTLDEIRHGLFHLHRFWTTGETRDLRDPEEFERAQHPVTCDCAAWPEVAETWQAPSPRLERLYEPLTV